MNRVALRIEYDGSDFKGFQKQKDQRSIEEELTKAISQFVNHPVKIVTAGRTDTGVHALGQVVHFDTASLRASNSWTRGVNSRLPLSIRVKESCLVSREFNARFSATSRTYRYYLLCASTPSAQFHRYLGWYHKALDLMLIKEAANYLIGEHDFSSFRASLCQAKSPIRNLMRLEVYLVGNLICFELKANAFLHHMVRNIVGALVYVGTNKLSPQELKDLLAAKNRTLAPPTFSPNGLYLYDVEYPLQLFIGAPRLPF